MTVNTSPHTATYLDYLGKTCPQLRDGVKARLQHIADQTAWDDPCSGLDWNNLGVVALIEAEQSTDLSLRSFYLNLAMEALQIGGPEHPLCTVHLAILHALLGEHHRAAKLAFGSILTTVHPLEQEGQPQPGLLYLPNAWLGWPSVGVAADMDFWSATTGQQQAFALASEVLWRSQLVFYNATGQRFLQLAAHSHPQSVPIHLQLGVAYLSSRRPEGLVYLHRAIAQQALSLTVLQALYLAYRDQGNQLLAHQWHTTGQQLLQEASCPASGQWTTVPPDHPWTYAQLEPELAIAVEPSFQSIVTSVLVATGDWFEREMEFWRQWLKPGMTIIDVGANVGVYTFSAAQRVGPTGRVIAIEPFSGCVRCLQATCDLNQFDWVTVVAGAASNHEGTALLALKSASELNELVMTAPENPAETDGETVACVTLDGICDREQLERVDCLKIDAEGHEMQVLEGSEHLIATHAPVILYENIAGSQGSNLEVTHYLRSKGYTVCRYQPFVQEHLPVTTDEDIHGCLNLIAWPERLRPQ